MNGNIQDCGHGIGTCPGWNVMGKTSTRYEYKGETKGGKPSHKFWIATQSGSQVTVHFGKVDTAGQTRVIDCGTVEEAEQYLQDKIAEKVKKGYKPAKS